MVLHCCLILFFLPPIALCFSFSLCGVYSLHVTLARSWEGSDCSVLFVDLEHSGRVAATVVISIMVPQSVDTKP